MSPTGYGLDDVRAWKEEIATLEAKRDVAVERIRELEQYADSCDETVSRIEENKNEIRDALRCCGSCPHRQYLESKLSEYKADKEE